MRQLVAYCGLDCEKCEARIATLNDDDALRTKVAKLWSELNGIDITPEMINCTGCRTEGVKTVYCGSLCEIRKCAMSRNYETCGDCRDIDNCNKVAMVIGNNKEARSNLSKN